MTPNAPMIMMPRGIPMPMPIVCPVERPAMGGAEYVVALVVALVVLELNVVDEEVSVIRVVGSEEVDVEEEEREVVVVAELVREEDGGVAEDRSLTWPLLSRKTPCPF
jgi:hypothetical protein